MARHRRGLQAWAGTGLAVAAVSLSACGYAHSPVVRPAVEVRSYAAPQWDLSSVTVAKLGSMLDGGFDPLFRDEAGDTALHWAAAARDPAYLELLLQRGYDRELVNELTGRTLLVTAMFAERDAQVRMLIAAGADLARGDAMDNGPLHVAAQINEPRYVLALLEAGSPAGARNRQSQTFQPYLFMAPDRLLNAETRRELKRVEDWLTRHGIAIERRTP